MPVFRAEVACVPPAAWLIKRFNINDVDIGKVNQIDANYFRVCAVQWDIEF